MVLISRPHTTLILALSVDGKIADRHRAPARFGSATDKAHLEQAIAAVDGVILGAGTLRAYHSSLAITQGDLLRQRSRQGQPPQPIHIVCSPSGHLDPQWRFFQQPLPRWLLTRPDVAPLWQTGPHFDRCLWLPDTPPDSWDWSQILAHLAQAMDPPLARLGILGGSVLATALVEQGCIDELKLTLCPLLLGGMAAPSLLGGLGFAAALAPRLHLLSTQVVADEIFLHYRLQPQGNLLSPNLC
ncbi:RibD family protein [Prochlorothrix hollandica]|uniref:Riboflavin deaminase n=1 Tax=Prochlorothrix hollandica PCC 9006 = CALU 1027 TaxID=317619 RepID=A0A0M2PWM4_PROHO|nr:RibD family protein [Prochlorothrix hollandica]KKI99083.1 riboflavin deaminase [Prochlorothrix hollandica PCC 9006 = CALU 1027]